MKVPGGALAAWRKYFAVALALMASLAIGGVGRSAEAADGLSVEAEHMSGGGKTYVAMSASNDKARLLYNNSGISREVSGSIARVSVRAKGDPCGGAPQMAIQVDGRTIKTSLVRSRKAWTQYSAAIETAGGEHEISTGFVNDRLTQRCDRNLRVDKLRFELADTPAPEPPPQDVSGPNPFGGEEFYANHNPAKQQVEEWRDTRPDDARQLEKIARNPMVQYFSTWANGRHVDNYVDTATAVGKLPVIGIYAIPNRDCGGYSAGGFTGAGQYRAWIDEVAAGVGSRKAVVIMEPDAVASWDCLSAAQREERIGLLKYAVQKLKSNPATHVYIDAGTVRWHTAEDTASRLLKVDVALADGFTLNHSNFFRTADNVAYGKKVSALIGGKHFVVDTSRNGNGPTADFSWCNPSGRALGIEPTADTGEPLVDAFFWLKTPGESDGPCAGYRGGGAWLPGYALGLARRAAY